MSDPPPRRTPVAATLSAYREPPCPNRWSGFFSHNGGLSGANDRLRGAASRRPTSGSNDPSRTQPSRGPTAPTLRPASTTPLTNPNGTRSRSLVREADRGPVGGDRCQSLATGPFACRSTPASKQSEVLAHSPWCKRTSKRIMTPRAPLLSPSMNEGPLSSASPDVVRVLTTSRCDMPGGRLVCQARKQAHWE
jgi:hypothetical protein